MPFADVNGARLFYTDAGAGPFTLLLMHGLSGDSHDWSWVIPMLQPRSRVLAVDLRGHGYSSRPATYELDDFVGDMVALAEKLGCEGLVPIGHSLGGAIAAVMAVQHPALVRAVVEVDPAYALPDWLVGMWEAFRAQWHANAGPGDDLTTYRPSLPPSASTPPFVETWHHRRAQAMSPEVFWKAFDGLADGPQKLFAPTPAAEEYLSRRRCPVLSFHSLPGRAAWESRLFDHPRSRAIEWEGSGHDLHIERPGELSALTVAWLTALAEDDEQGGPA